MPELQFDAHVNGFWRAALNVICGLLAFILGCGSIRKFFPLQVAGVSSKLQSFAQQKDDVDVVFIGTSRVFHGISPKAFDEAAGSLGFHCRSFNAGLDGLNPEEAFALIRRLLAFHPARVHYLFFELAALTGAGTPVGNDAVTERNVYWRDSPSLVSSVRIFAMEISQSGMSRSDSSYSIHRLSTFGPFLLANLRLWARNQTSSGEGFQLVRQRIDPQATSRPSPPQNWDGFFPMSEPMRGKTLATYREAFDKARNQPLTTRPDLIMRSELTRLAKRLRENNIQVVFIVPPSLLGLRGRAMDAPPGEPILVYEDYIRYPMFYDEKFRLDGWHLNGPGAELFSRTLASDFVHLIGVANPACASSEYAMRMRVNRIAAYCICK